MIALGLCTSALFAAPRAVNAVIETDPAALYAVMKNAYDAGQSKGWTYARESYYQSAILDTGRAYALFRPTDPNFIEVAKLAVDVATQLNYSPLTNNDGAVWYVREAAVAVQQSGDDAQKRQATTLLRTLDTGDGDPNLLAQQAVAGAKANAARLEHDPDASVAVVVALVRAYNLTHDVATRSELLRRMADLATPLTRVPDPEYVEMFALAADALTLPGYTDQNRADARAIAYRRAHTPELQVIARVSSMPHDLRLTRTAPADEYFGNLKYSPIGVKNEIARVDAYLDAGWGFRMEGDGLQIDSAIEDWQKQYPRDLTLPASILDAYAMLGRIDTPKARQAAAALRTILLVQYPGSRQAFELGDTAG